MLVNRDQQLRRARAMRRDSTPAERALWAMVRGKRMMGLKFRRQVPLGPYIADFVCLAPRLIVEADGGQHAESEHDAARDRWFAAQGFTVLRFWNTDILNEPEGVWRAICEAAGRD